MSDISLKAAYDRGRLEFASILAIRRAGTPAAHRRIVEKVKNGVLRMDPTLPSRVLGWVHAFDSPGYNIETEVMSLC